MNRVNWNGKPVQGSRAIVPNNLRETSFEFLPPSFSITSEIEELGHRYRDGQINWKHCGAMQAAAFVLPQSPDEHRKRREAFLSRVSEAEANEFEIPDLFRQLVETDACVDRLHHNSIWLQLARDSSPQGDYGRYPLDT